MRRRAVSRPAVRDSPFREAPILAEPVPERKDVVVRPPRTTGAGRARVGYDAPVHPLRALLLLALPAIALAEPLPDGRHACLILGTGATLAPVYDTSCGRADRGTR